jgi:hypothetical protein
MQLYRNHSEEVSLLRYIPEGCHLQTCRRADLKSHTEIILSVNILLSCKYTTSPLLGLSHVGTI